MKASLLAVAALIASGVVVLGCSHNSKQTRQDFDSMIGQNHAELIDALGPPDRTESDGEDGMVLIWDQYHSLGYFPGLYEPVAPGYQLYVVPPKELGYSDSLMFYMHADGTIYYWRIQKS